MAEDYGGWNLDAEVVAGLRAGRSADTSFGAISGVGGKVVFEARPGATVEFPRSWQDHGVFYPEHFRGAAIGFRPSSALKAAINSEELPDPVELEQIDRGLHEPPTTATECDQWLDRLGVPGAPSGRWPGVVERMVEVGTDMVGGGWVVDGAFGGGFGGVALPEGATPCLRIGGAQWIVQGNAARAVKGPTREYEVPGFARTALLLAALSHSVFPRAFSARNAAALMRAFAQEGLIPGLLGIGVPH